MSERMVFPAGDYWIGDPCYLFPHKGPLASKWDELLDKLNFFEVSYGELDNGKIKVWGSFTAYGDGLYGESNGGKLFPVDAGLLGIAPQETVDYLSMAKALAQSDLKVEDALAKIRSELEYSGLFVHFPESFVVRANMGNFLFDTIEIITGDVDDRISPVYN